MSTKNNTVAVLTGEALTAYIAILCAQEFADCPCPDDLAAKWRVAATTAYVYEAERGDPDWGTVQARAVLKLQADTQRVENQAVSRAAAARDAEQARDDAAQALREADPDFDPRWPFRPKGVPQK